MNYRNAKRLADGRIDCEIEHPLYGWIPFTADPADTGAQFDVAELHALMVADPATAPYAPPTSEEIAAQQEAERQFMRISFAQLLIGLVTEGWITAAEGRAWRDRVALPAPVQTLIASLPAAEQFAAETRALAPSEVLRLDPLVVGLGAATNKTAEEIDNFFRTYAQV